MSASAPQSTVWIKTGTLAASARLSGPAATVLIGPSVLGYVALQTYIAVPPAPEPGHHLSSHDPIGLGTESFVVVAFLIVGAEIVRRRIFYL
jgi:hypothetical protein